MASNHRGDDLGEIESAVDAVLVQTVYPEKGRTAGKEINCPQ
jgi:hypothetical protein